MYKLTFDIKQHTPIIHFQHEQDGAVLRATEVKPLLDKFLIERLLLTVNGRPREQFKRWFTNNDKLSIDYKIIIIAQDCKKYLIYNYLSSSRIEELDRKGTLYINKAPYFGDQMGIYSENLLFIIQSFNAELLSHLSYEFISSFFITHNFGNRKSKGFGSFTVMPQSVSKANEHGNVFHENTNEVNSEDVERVLENSGEAVYKKVLNDNDFTSIFSEINKTYQHLKSGYNLPGNYQKSNLFQYFSERTRETGWEKRKLKIEINKQIVFKEKLYRKKFDPLDFDYRNGQVEYLNTWEEVASPKYQFVRALLGLAETNEFQVEYFNKTENIYQEDKNVKYIVEISSSERNIDRMQSPLLFKVFENTIYVVAKEIPLEIFGATFDFILRRKKKINGKWTLDREEVELVKAMPVPSADEFNLVAFLDRYLVGREKGYSKL